ncbi:MAG TPA: TIGR02611 family protein [Micromonosporaceae bacterium]|nr:TIGR02611 family protein [Micromonosporaceae bacterium]
MPTAGPRERVSAWRERGRITLRVIRANPTGRIALKVSVAIAGAIVVAIGLVLIPLPGPGWALVILGLAIWAIEFVWAKHLLRFTRSQVQRWTRWVTRQSWPMRILLGLVGLVFVSTVVVLSLKYSFGIDVIADVWTYVTTH